MAWMILALLLLFGFNSKFTHGETFNVAFAASIESRLEELLSEPSIRALNPVGSAFNSRWEYIYDGDDDPGGRNHELIDHIDINATKAYLWTLMKPSTFDGTSGVDFVYAGFENGMFLGYRGPSPIQYVEMVDGNSSCPAFENRTERCRRSYSNSTDQTTGYIDGLPSLYLTYDPRYRPWYIQSLATSSGAVWTDPYVFASNGALGITATKTIKSASGQILGVSGVDYKLSTLDDALAEEELKSLSAINDYTIFVVDNAGYMIASSEIGASVEVINDTNTQVLSYHSNNAIIATVCQNIVKPKAQGGGGGWATSNGTILTISIDDVGLYWTQVREISNNYGLNWYVVIVELVSCDKGYYAPPIYTGTDCVKCPTGGVCEGGSTLPYPEAGYWIDRSDYDYGSELYRCVYDTCVGYESRQNKGFFSDDDVDCWTQKYFNKTVCSAEDLMCSSGAVGPLCGSCAQGYHYASASRRCEDCLNAQQNIPFYLFWGFMFCFILLAGIIITGQIHGGIQMEIWKKYLYKKLMILLNIFPFNLLKQIDSGMLKVIWVTAQIISTIPWNLSMKFPDPFDSFVEGHLIFFQLDFFPLHCFFKHSSYITRVYIISLTPILLVLFNGMVYFLRVLLLLGFTQPNAWIHPITKHKNLISKYASQHAYFALVLSYLVLPVVSMVQFAGLECVHLTGNKSFLRADTSVDCTDEHYKLFVVLDACLILAYQSVPLIWFILLYRARHKLNPQLYQHRQNIKTILNRRTESVAVGFRDRNHDSTIRHLAFLWDEYRPSRWYYEVFEMYRRTLFIAVLPLVGNSSELRAVVGCLISIIMISIVREASPFIRASTNLLLVVAQFQILLTFYAAVLIASGALGRLHLSNFVLGALIFVINLAVISVVIFFTAIRLFHEKDTKKYVSVLSDDEYEMATKLMFAGDRFDNDDEGGGVLTFPDQESGGEGSSDVDGFELMSANMKNKSRKSNHSLIVTLRMSKYGTSDYQPRYNHEDDHTNDETHFDDVIISSRDIHLHHRIGSASFGDIVKGSCVRQPVVLKTYKHSSEMNLILFKQEVKINAQLRHPNIVNFIGVCWDRELICMVLEWVPNGSLSDFLSRYQATCSISGINDNGGGGGGVSWNDPLLRLAIDIARGMSYLHNRGQHQPHHEEVHLNNETQHTNPIHNNNEMNQKKHSSSPILNLNLNPKNCLLNEYTCIKINLDLNKKRKTLKATVTNSQTFHEDDDSISSFFIAPEIIKNEKITEKADIFSFGMILLFLSCYQIDFLTFILKLWKKHIYHHQKQNKNENLFSISLMLKSILNHEWNLLDLSKKQLKQCPDSIFELIFKCCLIEPNKRPNFNEILFILKNKCGNEIDHLLYQPQAHQPQAASKPSHFQEDEYIGSFHGSSFSSSSSNSNTGGSGSFSHQTTNGVDQTSVGSGAATQTARMSQRLSASSIYKSSPKMTSISKKTTISTDMATDQVAVSVLTNI